jgi:hypothetical protein
MLPTGTASAELAAAMSDIRYFESIADEFKMQDGSKLRWRRTAFIIREWPRARCKAEFKIAVAEPDSGEARRIRRDLPSQ